MFPVGIYLSLFTVPWLSFTYLFLQNRARMKSGRWMSGTIRTWALSACALFTYLGVVMDQVHLSGKEKSIQTIKRSHSYCKRRHFLSKSTGENWTAIKYALSHCSSCILTANVPLILKMREIIFFCGQITLWAMSRDILRGPRLFWPSKLSRALQGTIQGSKKWRPTQNIPRNGP